MNSIAFLLILRMRFSEDRLDELNGYQNSNRNKPRKGLRKTFTADRNPRALKKSEGSSASADKDDKQGKGYRVSTPRNDSMHDFVSV